MKTVILGASVLALTATAQAATDTYEINIFGASAQAKFWNQAASDFLTDASTADSPACASVETGVHATESDNGIAIGTNCVDGDDTVIIRYRAKASFWGVASARGDDFDPADSCTTGGYAEMIDETSCSAGTCTADKCVDVTLGASDVAGESFTQKSTGWIFGPKSDFTDATQYVSYTFTGEETTGLSNLRPVVVPFSFFATDDLGIDNVSRLQAALLFSGAINNWEDVGIDPQGDDTTNTPVTLCLRHAGSGTHATMDHAVMHGDANLVSQDDPIGQNGPVIWFNEGSSDLMRCLSFTGNATFGLPATTYGIGYADSDKCGVGTQGSDPAAPGYDADWSSKCVGVERIKFQGIEGNRAAISNCMYPFWAAQWLYYDASEVDPVNGTGVLDGLVSALNAYASNPLKLDTLTGSQPLFWAAQDEMKCEKASDLVLPTKK